MDKNQEKKRMLQIPLVEDVHWGLAELSVAARLSKAAYVANLIDKAIATAKKGK